MSIPNSTALESDAGISAIRNLVTKNNKSLLNFLKRKTRNIEDAEDIAQEVWYQVSRYTGIAELENATAWLYSVATHKLTDYYRKNRMISVEDLFGNNETEDEEVQEDRLENPDNGLNPDTLIERSEIRRKLFEYLEELPNAQREVFVKNELEQKTLKQIAEEAGEKLKTIISRKLYALNYLRSKLRPVYDEFVSN